MKKRMILFADEGKILTDGSIYGKEIYLAEGDDENRFYEISQCEYDDIIEKMANEEV